LLIFKKGENMKTIELDCPNMIVLEVKEDTVVCGAYLKDKTLRKIEIPKDQLEKVGSISDLMN